MDSYRSDRLRLEALLAQTASHVDRELSTPFQIETRDPHELVYEAQVLLQEGLREDAKKALRLALIVSPFFSTAKNLLQEIAQRELQQLLYDDAPLLAPSLLQDRPPSELEGELEERTHFADWIASIEHSNGSDHHHVDTAIVLAEMGFFPAAIRELRRVTGLNGPVENPALWQQVQALQLQWIFLSGEVREAVRFGVSLLLTQLWLPEVHLELMYWTARALEAVEQFTLACEWFSEVEQQAPGYRDVLDRYKLLQRKGQSA